MSAQALVREEMIRVVQTDLKGSLLVVCNSGKGGYPPLPDEMSCLREGLVVQARGRATRHSKVDTLAVIFRRLWGCGSKNSSQEVNRRPEFLDILAPNTVIFL